MSTYGYRKQVSLPFAEAVAAVKSALNEQGFGVLSEIDVQKTLREKLDEETEPYVILGACNPHYAHRALAKEPELGLLLPCNVVVYESAGEVYAAAVDPAALLGVTGNDELAGVTREVEKRLRAAIDSLP